jgi:epoxyqueuosine reductase QueG
MQLSKEEIKEAALKYGADFAGVVNAESIPESVPPRKARDVLAGARSVIVFGVRMLSGSIQGPSFRVATTSNLAIYQEIDRIGYQLGRFLEENGYLAAVIPPYQPNEITRETRGMVGDLSLKHAAVGAGLGILGKNRLLLTPRWGPRVRLGAIVTDAPLPADQPVAGEVCLDCQICIEACPVGAISLSGNLDTAKCIAHLSPYGLGSFIKYLSQMIAKPPEEAQRLLRDPMFWNLYQYLSLGIMWSCFKCVEACPVGRTASI